MYRQRKVGRKVGTWTKLITFTDKVGRKVGTWTKLITFTDKGLSYNIGLGKI